jgi:signal transduction histidine kinase
MVVGPGRPNLEFRYAAASLSAPEHVTFRYRLEEFDDDWVEAGSRRVAYYPRLPSGRYRFTVTAANRNGVWNPEVAAVAFRVAAPLWNTWPFRLAVAATLIGLLGAILWRREVGIRRVRAAHEAFAQELIESQEHERKRIARELHDGLGQDLLVARNRALLALRDTDLGAPPREQLEEITEVTARSLATVRHLAHTLTPYQLDHLGLTAALRAVVETMADSAGLQLEIAMENVDRLLPTEGEINLYRIVQEALSNVVHHADASKVTVHVRRTGPTISLTIVDDGRGFAVHRDAEGRLIGGFGLSGMSERARILGSRLRVESARARGTRIEMAVPVPTEERP